MSGPAPAVARRRANEPERGEWQSSPGIGWQHGNIPACPARSKAAVDTWTAWMRSWYAAHWLPADLPTLRLVIKLWAHADSGKATGSERSELRQLMRAMGITPDGQQDRRWRAPETAPRRAETPEFDPREAYAGLRLVNG
jgi:hypothetical protein